MGKAVRDLCTHAVGEALAVRIISRAHLGRDRESGRDRQSNRRHAVKVRALAAKDIFVAADGFIAVRNTTTETKYVLSHPAANPLRQSMNVSLCSAAQGVKYGGKLFVGFVGKQHESRQRKLKRQQIQNVHCDQRYRKIC